MSTSETSSDVDATDHTPASAPTAAYPMRRVFVWALVIAALLLLIMAMGATWMWQHRSAMGAPLVLQGLKPVAVDVERYTGLWFQQLRLSSTQEPNSLRRVTLNYSLLRTGTQAGFMQVARSGVDADSGRQRNNVCNARACVGQPGVWRVSCAPFCETPFVVLAVDHDYQTAVAGTPDRTMLWLLTRERTATHAQFELLQSVALCNGYQQRQLDALVLGQTGLPAAPNADGKRPHRTEQCTDPNGVPTRTTTRSAKLK